jgi:hypothetical protein
MSASCIIPKVNRCLLILACLGGTIAHAQELVFPTLANWRELSEGNTLSFTLITTDSIMPSFSLDGSNEVRTNFDSLGNFSWTPNYQVVDRLEKQKEVTVIFQATWPDGRKIRHPITFVVHHKNQAPVVEELPVFYVKQSIANRYQIPADYVNDPDGDPIVFKSALSQMPEGASLSSQGLLSWTPSRNQFNALKNNPIILEFIVQDQPDKAETIGKLKIAQTQLDLPPELLLVPADSTIILKEDQLLSFKLYTSDPNGDENISTVGFVSSDTRVPGKSLKENTIVQHEFTWTPGYEFVEEAEKIRNMELTFFAIDKSTYRVQRKVKIQVIDTENIEEKDRLQYLKYRNSLIQAKGLIDLLGENHEVLTKAYRQAKKGKRNRSLVNASLGATAGLSPILLATDQSKIVSAIGGTTVLTLGTLEATEVIGKSKSDILDKMKINVEIKNQLQLEGDNFARKYALKSARRGKEFDADRDKLLLVSNNQKLVLLELDASRRSSQQINEKEIKKTFPDFVEE